MRSITLSDLKLGLDDFFEKRVEVLRGSSAAKIYLPRLEHAHSRINALPAALTGGTPLVDELAHADATHDGLGGAVYYVTEAYLLHPAVPAELAAAARRVRAAFIPALTELNAPYATEAHAARERRATLETHKADLVLFPVAPRGTLYHWVDAFLDAGEKLDTLLSERADHGATADAGSRKEAATLRSATLGLVTRFRAALADEVEAGKLAKNLDAQAFGYFDELLRMRRAAARKPATPAAPGETKPPTT